MKTLILDLETTGFGSTAEILQIGIIDSDGHILMNQYIKPTVCELTDTWSHAVEIHGITPERVANCPSLVSVLPAFVDITKGNHIVIYNAAFDTRFFDKGITDYFGKVSCCMLDFALAYQGTSKPNKSLEFACKHIGYDFNKDSAHDAIYDCQATLSVWQWLNKPHKDTPLDVL